MCPSVPWSSVSLVSYHLEVNRPSSLGRRGRSRPLTHQHHSASSCINEGSGNTHLTQRCPVFWVMPFRTCQKEDPRSWVTAVHGHPFSAHPLFPVCVLGYLAFRTTHQASPCCYPFIFMPCVASVTSLLPSLSSAHPFRSVPSGTEPIRQSWSLPFWPSHPPIQLWL